jgi:glycosyltransferase involved in cell wall biosynthesis
VTRRNQSLKVLHICQRDDPATGGAVRVAVEYVKRLPQYDVDAHCLFLYGSPGAFRAELEDQHTHYLGIKSSKELPKFNRLRGFLRDFQPQVIHHHDGLLWPQLFTFLHPGIIKVAHAHLPAGNTSFLSKGALAAWSQLHSTDMLVCITEYTRQSQIKQGGYAPQRTQVIYNGVDRARFYPPSETERQRARKQLDLPADLPVVGFMGRLHCATKGVDDFLRAVALLPSYFRALVAGSGADASTLKHLAEELGIAERVIFAGTVQTPAVAYHVMDAFCLTSHWESFGLVVAEALACRVPVIAFACPGGVNELLTRETGCVLPNRNVQAMAQAIIEAIDRPGSWTQRHQNAEAQLYKNHDWDRNTLKLASLYQQLTNEATPHPVL